MLMLPTISNFLKNHRIRFVFCHRNPDRTFKIHGIYFPVCSRCTGIYMGFIFSFVLSIILDIDFNLHNFFLAILLMMPTTIDAFTQFLKWRESNNLLRFITGLIGGIGYGIAFFIILNISTITIGAYYGRS